MPSAASLDKGLKQIGILFRKKEPKKNENISLFFLTHRKNHQLRYARGPKSHLQQQEWLLQKLALINLWLRECPGLQGKTSQTQKERQNLIDIDNARLMLIGIRQWNFKRYNDETRPSQDQGESKSWQIWGSNIEDTLQHHAYQSI